MSGGLFLDDDDLLFAWRWIGICRIMAFACFPRYLVRCSGNLASSRKSGTDNSEMQTYVIPMIEAMRIEGNLRDLILRRIIGAHRSRSRSVFE